MNIAIVTTWFPAGGGYVSKAYQRVLEKEHDIYIYARGGKVMKDHPEWDAANVTWAPRHYNGIKTNHFLNWAKEKKIDVIFFNEQRFWKPVLEAKKAGFSIGAYIDYYTQATVPAFGIYDFLICNTKRHYSVFDWHHNAHYIPWGTDISTFRPSYRAENDKVTFIISAGWQGKFTGDRRGTLLALEAFGRVKGDCRLIVYSQIDFEECLPNWQRLIKADQRIELKVGTFDPFPYSEGDVYLYPSRLDGIGLTLPEAVSSGLAAITTNNRPMNEFVSENYNGFLIDVDKYLGRPDGYYWAESICSTTALNAAMQKYIDNPKILLQHKENARAFAEKNLNWDNNSSEILKIFESSVKNRKSRDENLIKLLNKLDKSMAPSQSYKIASAIYGACKNLVKN